LEYAMPCGHQRGALGHVETKGSFSTFWRQRPLRQMSLEHFPHLGR
jgi:hypothetical protein